MANIKIKFDEQKIIKNIERKIDNIQFSNIVDKTRKGGKMFILQKSEEEMLSIILEKYDGNIQMKVSGEYNDFPEYMKFNISNLMNKLKISGFISEKITSFSGWKVILTPDGITYFEEKGMRKELFEELPNTSKDLLKELLQAEQKNLSINELLKNKLEEDTTDKIIRGIIGTLKKNGLLIVRWADNTVYYAELTDAGRSYFEREKKYIEQLNKLNTPSVNIENLTNSGFLNMGNITNSNITINNSIEHIEKQIEENGQEDKEELKQLLQEVKDYIDNINETKMVTKNTGLFKRIGEHFDKHQWFYNQVISVLGQVIMKVMGNQ